MKLRHKGDIWRTVKAPDGRGGWTMQPQLVARGVWMSIVPMSTQERLQYQKLESTVNTRILMRYREDLDTSCYIERGDMRYELDAPGLNPGQANRMLEFTATALVLGDQ